MGLDAGDAPHWRQHLLARAITQMFQIPIVPYIREQNLNVLDGLYFGIAEISFGLYNFTLSTT